jgi:hypothetical protein
MDLAYCAADDGYRGEIGQVSNFAAQPILRPPQWRVASQSAITAREIAARIRERPAVLAEHALAINAISQIDETEIQVHAPRL